MQVASRRPIREGGKGHHKTREGIFWLETHMDVHLPKQRSSPTSGAEESRQGALPIITTPGRTGLRQTTTSLPSWLFFSPLCTGKIKPPVTSSKPAVLRACSRPVASASPRDLLEMQIIDPIPNPTESEAMGGRGGVRKFVF